MEEIAIIGMAGYFPGAENIEQYWQNLKNGVESVSSFSNQQLEDLGVPPSIYNQPNYVKAGVILENLATFDAAFFGYTPREAELIDPQQRLFLECAWHALEDAGYDATKYDGLIGVYAGTARNGYLWFNLLNNTTFIRTNGDLQTLFGNDKDYLTTRVSYKMNLKGPSVDIQTACSSSLVALHFAHQGLLTYQCDIALVGGAAAIVPQKIGNQFEEGGILSPDGHCRAFDAKAQGTILGSGAGVVVLKRLSEALAAGDTIHAVIKGSAINNDGASKVGFTAPSIEGQAEVIAMAQAAAGVEPETISYVETHGTATPLGDPIEVAALTQAFRYHTPNNGTPINGFCAIGSVKTNIGHLDAAAGIAGLIKTVLALKHRQIPPSLHFEKPNPNIDFENSPFYVNAHLQEWHSPTGPRRAGVSSFGIGGTNAHVILEEAPLPSTDEHALAKDQLDMPVIQLSDSVLDEQSADADTSANADTGAGAWEMLVLSAKTPSALKQLASNLHRHLLEHQEQTLADVAFTLQMGRQAFEYRQVIVCRTRQQALEALASFADLNPPASSELIPPVNFKPAFRVSGKKLPVTPRLVFMFPGGGSQYVNMGRELYQSQPLFRQHVDYCSDYLKPLLGHDLRDILYPGWSDTQLSLNPDLEYSLQLIHQPNLTLPILFVVEYALAQLWLSWGVVPEAMVGHSLGEYLAACLAGVFSLENALKLVALRGQILSQLPNNGMLSINISETEVQDFLKTFPSIDIAAINSPNYLVLAGPVDQLAALELSLKKLNINSHRLHLIGASHTRLLETVLPQFRTFIEQLTLSAPTIPYLSNLTGTWITPQQATDPLYWVNHMRHTVRFSDNITCLLQEHNPNLLFLEVGPGQTLANLVKLHLDLAYPPPTPNPIQPHHPTAPQTLLTNSLPAANELGSHTALSAPLVLQSLSKLWIFGLNLTWDALRPALPYQDALLAPTQSPPKYRRISLPGYPFQRHTYWIAPANSYIADNTDFEQAAATNAARTTHSYSHYPSSHPHPDVPLPLPKWFYVPSWQQSVGHQNPQPELQLEAVANQHWLVFLEPDWLQHHHQDSLAKTLLHILTTQGVVVTTVVPGDCYQLLPNPNTDTNPPTHTLPNQTEMWLGGQHNLNPPVAFQYQLRPDNAEDYYSLIESLKTEKWRIDKVVHLWNLQPDQLEPADEDDTAAYNHKQTQLVVRSFNSVIWLAQQLDRATHSQPVELNIVTSGAVAVSDEERLLPEKALVLGPARVISQEYPSIRCRVIDLEAKSLSGQGDTLRNRRVRQLAAELSFASPDWLVAYRGRNQRWVRNFAQASFNPQPSLSKRLRSKGVYLITGGLGGIGLSIAHYLAQKVQAKLILVSRSTFPSRYGWEEWLNKHNDQDSTSWRIRQVQALEELGAEVVVGQADVAEMDQMQALLQSVKVRFGSIQGVVHCAGVPGNGMISLKTAEQLKQVLSAKVYGTRVLERVLRSEPIDWMVLCSSLTAIGGGIGQVDYCGANAFLDAYAHYQQQREGVYTLSINWPIWQGRGILDQVDPGQPNEVREMLKAAAEQRGLSREEGAEVFERLLTGTIQPQIVVSKTNLEEFLYENETSEKSSLITALEEYKVGLPIYDQPRVSLSSTYLPPTNPQEQKIVEVWQKLLGVELIGINDNFFELGGHSLLGIQMLHLLREVFNVSLPLHRLLEGPTVAELGQIIEKVLLEEIENLTEEEVEYFIASNPEI